MRTVQLEHGPVTMTLSKELTASRTGSAPDGLGSSGEIHNNNAGHSLGEHLESLHSWLGSHGHLYSSVTILRCSLTGTATQPIESAKSLTCSVITHHQFLPLIGSFWGFAKLVEAPYALTLVT